MEVGSAQRSTTIARAVLEADEILARVLRACPVDGANRIGQ